MAQLLFNSGFLRDTLAKQTQAMLSEIGGVSDDDVLAVAEIEWAQALAVRYSLASPEIKADEFWFEEPQPKKIDVTGDPRFFGRPDGGRVVADGYRSVLHVPYTGYRAAFSLQPGRPTYNPPAGRVLDGDVVHEVLYHAGSSPDWQAIADKFITTLELWVGFTRSDIEGFNALLVNQAQMTIRNRRERIEHNRAQIRASGVRFGPPRDASKTYIPDVVKLRPSPRIPARKDQAIPFEPALVHETYDHILNVIRLTTASFEQSPGTYAEMGEEDLRQVIRAALNTHYDGAAHAEAFNFRGKTDILITEKGRSLFIAECKFWTGPSAFTETLNQLFGYQAWRDTKLAVIMFVRNRGFTGVVGKGRETLAEHPQFVRWGQTGAEVELRAAVHWNGDDQRQADLNVLFVSIPSA